jgi:3-hydroxy acid dehydrogenase/malonic semialdehyde reductase
MEEIFKMKKIAIVTGASLGIGAATALKLASLDYHVFSLSRDYEKLKNIASKFPNNIEPYKLDITNYNEVDIFFKYLNNLPVDVLINNAGGGTQHSDIENMNTNLWKICYDTNVIAAANMVKKCIPNFINNKKGNIVFITSTAANNFFPGGANYSGVKMAESILSKYLRDELHTKNIKVTEISPGTVNSRENTDKNALLPEDIANSISWLLSMPDYVNINLIDISHINNLSK